jgi:cell division transport system ATP-binding protein
MATTSKILTGTRRRGADAPIAPPHEPVLEPSSRRRVIEFRGVSKLYAGDVGLDQATFSVDRGEFVFLVGSTGSGKSTLMRLLIKELEPTGGTITVAGHDLSEITRKRVPYYRRNVGVVFQDFKLLPNLSVFQNVAFALRVTEGALRHLKPKVEEVLSIVGLEGKEDKFPDQLSGGEQQRVAIARALVHDPKIFLADEPTGNLDPATSWEIIQLLLQINARGTTVLMATHNREIVDVMRRRVVAIEGGQIVRDEDAGGYHAPALESH